MSTLSLPGLSRAFNSSRAFPGRVAHREGALGRRGSCSDEPSLRRPMRVDKRRRSLMWFQSGALTVAPFPPTEHDADASLRKESPLTLECVPFAASRDASRAKDRPFRLEKDRPGAWRPFGSHLSPPRRRPLESHPSLCGSSAHHDSTRDARANDQNIFHVF
jgi:hypothetical protein